jgi:hypothetical protein
MIKATSALFAALALGACASQIGHHTGDLAGAHARLGQAVRTNIAVQTVNPEGSSADVAASAARTAAAVKDYQTDNVEKPSGAGTLIIQSGGGGG